jgi:hypothetical protein
MTRVPPMRRRLWVPALLMAAIAFSAGWAQQKPAVPAENESEAVDVNINRRALIASGEAPDLFLLHTGDVIGYLDPCG